MCRYSAGAGWTCLHAAAAAIADSASRAALSQNAPRFGGVFVRGMLGSVGEALFGGMARETTKYESVRVGGCTS